MHEMSVWVNKNRDQKYEKKITSFIIPKNTLLLSFLII